MRSFRSAVLVSCLLTAATAAAQTPEPPQQIPSGPTPLDVLASPKTHAGAAVAWVVRFKSLVIDFDTSHNVENDRVAYEWRDATGAWTGRVIIAPPVRQTRWTDAAIAASERMFGGEPRLLMGTVRGLEAGTDAEGRPYVAVVLDSAKLDTVPLTPKNRVTEPTFGAGVYEPGKGISWPQVVREAKPVYPRDAVAQKIKCSVELELVVNADGTVGDVRVTRTSLETDPYGFAQAAIEAAKKWTFKPGVKDGVAVPTRVSLILEFRAGSREPDRD